MYYVSLLNIVVTVARVRYNHISHSQDVTRVCRSVHRVISFVAYSYTSPTPHAQYSTIAHSLCGPSANRLILGTLCRELTTGDRNS